MRGPQGELDIAARGMVRRDLGRGQAEQAATLGEIVRAAAREQCPA
jgi:hypothetical protein